MLKNGRMDGNLTKSASRRCSSCPTPDMECSLCMVKELRGAKQSSVRVPESEVLGPRNSKEGDANG